MALESAKDKGQKVVVDLSLEDNQICKFHIQRLWSRMLATSVQRLFHMGYKNLQLV